SQAASRSAAQTAAAQDSQQSETDAKDQQSGIDWSNGAQGILSCQRHILDAAALVGLLLFALGLVFTVGLNWLSSNDSVQDWLKTISDLLKSHTGQEIEIQQFAEQQSVS
uniref:Flagellar M-ring protein FliF n=1 Tax=Macrostomum lignano TaxID=282301 RepID=A0A1I8FB82_9PLAT